LPPATAFAWWKSVFGGVIGIKCDADLPQVVHARRSPRAFSSGLDRRQENCEQYSNNCDHDQQLDQGECKTLCG
jgi:hypothetical protein